MIIISGDESRGDHHDENNELRNHHGHLMQHPRPILVLSKCLELEACRYNGQKIRAPFVLQLMPHVETNPVCPEVEIGLGIPRDPIRLITLEGSPDDAELIDVDPRGGPVVVRGREEWDEYMERNLGAIEGIGGVLWTEVLDYAVGVLGLRETDPAAQRLQIEGLSPAQGRFLAGSAPIDPGPPERPAGGPR